MYYHVVFSPILVYEMVLAHLTSGVRLLGEEGSALRVLSEGRVDGCTVAHVPAMATVLKRMEWEFSEYVRTT